MTLSTTPPLDTYNVVTLSEDTEFNGTSNAPLQALVDVDLPVGLVEVWLGFAKEEGVDTTVEMRVL